ncbi:hypothetical protein V6N13_042384 [Hibiscus sabdariffa]|uniref:Uncharacterized protein n=1 Tax=Hibiscus sabdariffa TaxID=183260 RepID=A0ABR2DHS5_9ROSI
MGKHSREEEPSVGASNSKALRIDDTDETVKSSMVATLVMKTKNTMNSGGIFNGLPIENRRRPELSTENILDAASEPGSLVSVTQLPRKHMKEGDENITILETWHDL